MSICASFRIYLLCIILTNLPDARAIFVKKQNYKNILKMWLYTSPPTTTAAAAAAAPTTATAAYYKKKQTNCDWLLDFYF